MIRRRLYLSSLPAVAVMLGLGAWGVLDWILNGRRMA